MRDLIDRDEAIEAIRTLPNAGMRWFVSAEAVFDKLLKLPSVEPAKHGRWKEWEYERWGATYYQCSECGFEPDKKTRFCPNCGAKMDA